MFLLCSRLSYLRLFRLIFLYSSLSFSTFGRFINFALNGVVASRSTLLIKNHFCRIYWFFGLTVTSSSFGIETDEFHLLFLLPFFPRSVGVSRWMYWMIKWTNERVRLVVVFFARVGDVVDMCFRRTKSSFPFVSMRQHKMFASIDFFIRLYFHFFVSCLVLLFIRQHIKRLEIFNRTMMNKNFEEEEEIENGKQGTKQNEISFLAAMIRALFVLHFCGRLWHSTSVFRRFFFSQSCCCCCRCRFLLHSKPNEWIIKRMKKKMNK